MNALFDACIVVFLRVLLVLEWKREDQYHGLDGAGWRQVYGVRLVCV